MPIQHYEPGTYAGKVTAQRFGETPTGSPYFAVEVEPSHSTGANGFPDQVFRREVTFYLTEKAAPYSIKNLRRLGWQGSSFAELDPTREGHHSFVDTPVNLVCEYNDKGYEDWNLTNPGGGAPKESDKALPSKLDKLFGKALKSTASKAPAAAQQPQTVPAAVDDDDVPF